MVEYATMELAAFLTPLYLFCVYFVIRTEHRLTSLEQHCEDTHGVKNV